MKKVLFLLDKQNTWIKKYIYNFKFKLNKNFYLKISDNKNLIRNYDIIFLINYLKILPKKIIEKKLCFLVHESNLPKNRGGAPLQHQILNGDNKIYLSLIRAREKVDSGEIFLKSSFKLNGTELNDEIRKIQAINSFKLVEKFLKNYNKLKPKKQIGKPTYNKRRTKKDSLINVNKSLKNQFNLLRVCDNEKYPAYFILKNKKYILKIFKD